MTNHLSLNAEHAFAQTEKCKATWWDVADARDFVAAVLAESDSITVGVFRSPDLDPLGNPFFKGSIIIRNSKACGAPSRTCLEWSSYGGLELWTRSGVLVQILDPNEFSLRDFFDGEKWAWDIHRSAYPNAAAAYVRNELPKLL